MPTSPRRAIALGVKWTPIKDLDAVAAAIQEHKQATIGAHHDSGRF